MNLLEGYKTVLTLDDKGRVVIPAKIRDLLKLERGSVLELVYQFDVMMLYVKSEEEQK